MLFLFWSTLFATETSAASLSVAHPEGKGVNMPLPKTDQSDWDWVKMQVADDAPVPYNASDPDDGPYDPNEDEAVDRILTEANRIYPPKGKKRIA
jgi:hypothetical protein